jgi:hypothetical protein
VAGVEHTGGHSAIVLAVQLIGENIIKKIHCGLRWPPIDVFDSTINQKWAGMEEKRVEKGTNVGEWQRDANSPRLHVEGERGQHTALSTIEHCWVMTLSALTPIR